jgi:aspartate/methionine/tyrosine aminotransferase
VTAPLPEPLVSRERLAARMAGLRPSLYARLLSRLAGYQGEVFPFHIGELHLPPIDAVQGALRDTAAREVGRYGHPQGLPELREAVAQRARTSGMGEVCPAQVVVTHGATHGLNLACQALLDPGDEVLVLSPHWPLIVGMVQAACATPVEVRFTCQVGGVLQPGKVAELLSRHLTPRTRAVYFTSPNNPDGVVLDAPRLRELARFCVAQDLWALADEAYASFVYQDRPPHLASFPGMAERTVSVFSFSKSHRIAGLRAGYAVAPPDVVEAMSRLANLSVYNVALVIQRAALAALAAGPDAEAETVQAARAGRDLACQAFDALPGVRFGRPQGGAYLFVNLEAILGDRDCHLLLEHCLDQGVVFAPGEGFGAAYSRWARFCYTAMPPDRLGAGLERLGRLLRSF